jgi:UDP-N-acetylglucosamine--N-acetylmuramyl-(pentapeptide) pyrophosphoryl-undecaprenol N-acetylglucosamine transferase
MKLVLTGAGGGHFYPLIAVNERVEEEVKSQKIIDIETFFFSDKEYNKNLLDEKKIKFVRIPAGKLRLYFSIQNFFDPFKSVLGFFVALWKLFIIYPDVVFVKGGYSSMPVLLAAKCLFIPIFVHESDSVPGKTTLFAGKLAKRIAVSYATATKYFNLKKTAYTGQPILEEYLPTKDKLDRKYEEYTEEKKKTILVMGGSQGSEIINNILLESLSELLEKYNIVHQVGPKNLEAVKISTEVLLKDNPNRDNYKYFSTSDLSKYYELADVCITRAGSSLFELSAWGIPSIIIPITNSNKNHQMENASIFEKAGCSIIIEEINLKKNLFLNEIDSILEDKKKHEMMQFNNLNNFKDGAAEVIAKEIVRIGLSHN